MNVHHEEQVGSSTTTLHGRDAHDFSSSGCEQMVTEPVHIDRDVPDLMTCRGASLLDS